jgi:hypothetical protein
LRTAQNITEQVGNRLLTPYYHLAGKPTRYYQEIAINLVVHSSLQGKKRILLTLATGTGKTMVAFQVCWKLTNCLWNRTASSGDPGFSFGVRAVERTSTRGAVAVAAGTRKVAAAHPELRRLLLGLAGKGRSMRRAARVDGNHIKVKEALATARHEGCILRL